MRRHLVLIAVPFALAGCGHKAHQETQTTVTRNGVTTTTITNRDVDAKDDTISGLKIDSDKFKANIEVPGLSFGGDHMDMDGMKLYPGSRVKGVRVHAVDRPGAKSGEVVMDFTSPAAPAVVARHMADQARHAGFTLSSDTPSSIVGTKAGDHGPDRFAVTLNPNGDATVGQVTLTDAH